jgi:predicted transcriptional regulator
MADIRPVTGELQTQVMSAVWRLGHGNVAQVRSALPPRYRAAYNTIQTVLNRLAERGLLSRHQGVKAIEYRPRITEAEYVSRLISQTLAGASTATRHAALALIVGDLGNDEVRNLQRLASEMEATRRQR